jgi:hypothetical protein
VKEITGYTSTMKSGRELARSMGSGALGLPLVEMSSGGGGEMAACGKSHHADAVRIDAEFLGAGTHQANGALGIAEFDGMVVLGSEAVLEDERGDAEGVQPVGFLAAFVIGGEPSVAAAGSDDDRGAGRSWILRKAGRR